MNFSRLDSGEEYILDSLKQYFKLCGIYHRLTNANTLQDNSFTEHIN